MKALREWLIQQGWFIVEVDPSPEAWTIKAIAPTGTTATFYGTAEACQSRLPW
jgi:hypothetical protein